MDAIELAIHRSNTKAFIDVKPSELSLKTIATRERTDSGGFKDIPGTTRDPQTFRIIELGVSYTPPVLKLQDGKMREQEFWLLGEHNAQIAVGDHWKAEDGREWEVGDIVRPNGYEQRALVAERGK